MTNLTKICFVVMCILSVYAFKVYCDDKLMGEVVCGKSCYLPEKEIGQNKFVQTPPKTTSGPNNLRNELGVQIAKPPIPTIKPKKKPLPKLVQAIRQVESSGGKYLRGKAGERGCMQVKYVVWKSMTKKMGVKWDWNSAYNSDRNIRVGTAYLNYLTNYLKKKSAYSLDNLLICYNMGPTAWNRVYYSGKSFPGSVRNYVSKVRSRL